MRFRFGSVCSGVEAASVAWHPLGWETAFVSDIAPYPCAVLKYRFPSVPNIGSMLDVSEDTLRSVGPIDLLVGGTPCQSFSMAGQRRGLGDARGNLALRFVQLADFLRPRWVVWENVPGVLSSGGGRDFGSIIGALGSIGYGWSYRVLNARGFGVPQSRRRVFLVGYLGDWKPSLAALFDKERIANDDQVSGSEPERENGSGSGDAPQHRQGAAFINAVMDAGLMGLTSVPSSNPCLFTGTLCKSASMVVAMTNPDGSRVMRYMSPIELERLQGFPDNWTLVPGYKASEKRLRNLRSEVMGNSMAVPVMHWIGRRIQLVDRVLASAKDHPGPRLAMPTRG